MQSIRRALALALAAAVFAGCRDGGTPVGSSAASAPPQISAEQVGEVARGLAVAMRSEPVRLAVRDAMRASRVTEHKLVLQEFLRSPAGEPVAVEAARALEQSPEALKAAVDALPPLDFYVPSREHRMTWRGSRDVAVAYLGGTPGVVTGFDVQGARTEFRRGERAETVLFLLAPAESKGRRIGAQPDGPGEVIQDANDGELSMSIVDTDAEGKQTVLDLADLPYRNGEVILPGGEAVRVAPVAGKRGEVPAAAPRGAAQSLAPAAAGPQFSTTSPADTTRLDYIIIYFEDNLTDDHSEIELRATYHRKDGSIGGSRTLRMEGVRDCWDIYATCYYYTPRVPMIFNRIRDQTTERISVHLIETDSWPNGDDDKGWANITWDDNGRLEYFLRGGARDADAIFGWTPVAPIVGRVTFTPGPIIVQHPATVTLTARVTDPDGREIDVPVSWRVYDPTVATVTPTGNRTATLTTHRVGYSYVYARAQHYETYHPVNALGPVTRVDITPSSVFNRYVGESWQVVAEGRDANGNGPVPGKTVTWSSDDPSIVSVSAAGVLSFVSPGSTTIRATIDGVTGTAAVSARHRPVQWVSISPYTVNTEVGTMTWFSATVYGEGSVTLYDRPVTWSLSDPSLAAITSSSGSSAQVLTTAGGTVTLYATVEGVQGSATISIQQDIEPVYPCESLEEPCTKTPRLPAPEM